ncbi:hypothetical protein GDO78_021841 [Eleutherodactylus coqui]|uniref:Uncharacterized protein n=1 Tax=Eleutherodactylus coqui TaxID=57060 RepID=A0A8J6BEB3_ELECQ|nr:hypothetical protein GDO78_021841 [Eleutherodactylus coqui]
MLHYGSCRAQCHKLWHCALPAQSHREQTRTLKNRSWEILPICRQSPASKVLLYVQVAIETIGLSEASGWSLWQGELVLGCQRTARHQLLQQRSEKTSDLCCVNPLHAAVYVTVACKGLSPSDPLRM